MQWVRGLIWAVLAVFAVSTLWLVLSGALGERIDAKRAARLAEQGQVGDGNSVGKSE